MDYNIFGDSSEWIYQCLATGINCTNNSFCMGAWGGSSSNLYCITISASSNCFACCGLKQKQYCLFNRQYTPEEYQKLAGKIVEHMQETGEWGEFFPPSMSPFALNETIANSEYPLDKTTALQYGYNWADIEEKVILHGDVEVPDNINETDESICSKKLRCVVTGKAYKIIPQEFNFHMEQGIPLSNTCPDSRYRKNLEIRNQRKLFPTHCAKCGTPIQTSFCPEQDFQIFCEDCYRDAVY